MLPDGLYPALEELVALVAPPAAPMPVEGDWRSFASTNGFEPPSEWMALLARYGYCMLGGEAIQLRDPFPSEGSFVACSELERRELRGWISIYDWYPRWPIWPDDGGFLPWADIRDGSGTIGWLTIGAPDAWRVAVLQRGGDGRETGLGTLDFLVHLARNIDVADFSQAGLGWMDDHTSIPYRVIPWMGLPDHEPLKVTFAAVPCDVHDEPRPDDVAELRAWFDRGKAIRAPSLEAWEQRWASARSVLDSAATEEVHFSPCGFRGFEPGWIHPFSRLGFPVGSEARARQALSELASALGTTVFEVRNLEQQLVWTDLYGHSFPRDH